MRLAVYGTLRRGYEKTGKVKGKFQDTIFGNHKKYVEKR